MELWFCFVTIEGQTALGYFRDLNKSSRFRRNMSKPIRINFCIESTLRNLYEIVNPNMG